MVFVLKFRPGLRRRVGRGSVRIDEQILAPEQPVAAGSYQVEIAVAVEIDDLRIDVEAGLAGAGDLSPMPDAVRAVKFVPVNDQRIPFAQIFAVVPKVTLAGDNLGTAIAVE